MKKVGLILVVIVTLSFLVGCAGGNEAAVSGNIISQGGGALPDGANIQVQIQDVSLADAPAKVIGEQTIDGSGKSFPDFKQGGF